MSQRQVLRISSGLILALLLWGLMSPPPARAFASNEGSRDIDTYARTIERIRQGEPYYEAVGAELRRGHYPTSPVFNWRTPLFYEAVAGMSVPIAQWVLRGLAAVAVGIAVTDGPLGALALVFAVLPALMGNVLLPEIWCGTLIAVSAGLYRRRVRLAAAGAGLLALFLRELAAPYVLCCGLLALRDRERKESALWCLGGLAYMLYFGVHAWTASRLALPTDAVQTHSWISVQGVSFVIATTRMFSLVSFAPRWVVTAAVAAGLIGCCAPSAPRQIAWSLPIYVLCFLIAGQPFDYYWGYVTCGLWGYSLVAAPQGLQAIVAAWRPRPLRGTLASSSPST